MIDNLVIDTIIIIIIIIIIITVITESHFVTLFIAYIFIFFHCTTDDG